MNNFLNYEQFWKELDKGRREKQKEKNRQETTISVKENLLKITKKKSIILVQKRNARFLENQFEMFTKNKTVENP